MGFSEAGLRHWRWQPRGGRKALGACGRHRLACGNGCLERPLSPGLPPLGLLPGAGCYRSGSVGLGFLHPCSHRTDVLHYLLVSEGVTAWASYQVPEAMLKEKDLPILLWKRLLIGKWTTRNFCGLQGAFCGWLIASLPYGAGLRLLECLCRRVQDIDFAHNKITVRTVKARRTGPGCYPTLPDSL